MARKAILLVEVVSGKTVEVCDHLSKLESVRSAFRVTPPYDIIAVLEAESSKDINDDVSFLEQRVDGIIRVVVCSAVDFEAGQVVTRVEHHAATTPA
jgi:hypothetical protein